MHPFPSPKASSSDLLARQVAADSKEHPVPSEILRISDFNVKPGVLKDMGESDQWPPIRQTLLAADTLVLSTPIWVGHPSSLAQRVLERLDTELSETDEQGRPILFGKVGLVAVVGNEDGAHHVIADLGQGLADAGFTLAAQGSTCWVGQAMHTTDCQDLQRSPESTAIATGMAIRNAAHLARLLKASPCPAG